MAVDNECSVDDSTNSLDVVSSKSTESQRKHANETPEDFSIFDVSLIETSSICWASM
jgi:hypothetical protein